MTRGRSASSNTSIYHFLKLFQGLAGELVNVLREAGQIVPDALKNFGTHVKKNVCIYSFPGIIFLSIKFLCPLFTAKYYSSTSNNLKENDIFVIK